MVIKKGLIELPIHVPDDGTVPTEKHIRDSLVKAAEDPEFVNTVKGHVSAGEATAAASIKKQAGSGKQQGASVKKAAHKK